ncbi:MAG: Tfp pilus assembly protein FimT/FimU, partial [Clostridia bacterium]
MRKMKILITKRVTEVQKDKNKKQGGKKRMTKEKQNSKGITLIALVVTIVVLLILAGITIAALFGDNGLIERAKIADQKTKEGAANDISAIENLDAQVNKIVNGTGDNPPGITPTSTIEELMANASTDNEIVLDKYGNPVKVPAGFKILAHGTRKWKPYS